MKTPHSVNKSTFKVLCKPSVVASKMASKAWLYTSASGACQAFVFLFWKSFFKKFEVVKPSN